MRLPATFVESLPTPSGNIVMTGHDTGDVNDCFTRRRTNNYCVCLVDLDIVSSFVLEFEQAEVNLFHLRYIALQFLSMASNSAKD